MRLLKKITISLSPRSYAVFFDPSDELLTILAEAWDKSANTRSFEYLRDTWQVYMPATLCTFDPRFSERGERWRKKYAKRAVFFFVEALSNEEGRQTKLIQDLLKSSDFEKYVIFQVRDLSVLDLNQKPSGA